ncbi:MAG: two pore domain potassium channel family protein [Tidjanibacter sp.]|nr:two pore domain potassium channel family protein [Tidjanibacter sp.]
MKQQSTISPANPFARVLNLLTLLGSLVILITLSHDIIYSRNYTLSNSLLHLQLFVCMLFMADWVAGVTFAEKPMRWAIRNIFWLLVSLPWLNILKLVGAGDITKQLYLVLKCLPLIRGLYGIYPALQSATRPRSTRIFLSYIYITLAVTYLSALLFFCEEEGLNSAVDNFGTALWWAGLNVTTVGAPLFAVTATGKILTFLLPALGMMLFPIFTVYITNLVEKNTSDRQ